MEKSQYKKMEVFAATHWWYRGRRTIAQKLIRAYAPEIASQGSVLDVGCGAGESTFIIDDPSRLTGFDMSEEALTLARNKGYGALYKGEAEQLPFPGSEFSGVLALDVLEHIAGDEAMLRECARVLKPGGILFLTVPAYAWLWSGHDLIFGHKRRYAHRALREQVMRAGFSVTFSSYYVSILFPLVLVFRMVARLAYRKPTSHFFPIPSFLNTLLYDTLALEGSLLARGFCLPFGSSIALVARKN